MEIIRNDNLTRTVNLHSGLTTNARPRGFTLIEIIIVIVIISIASAMVVPMMSSANGTQLRSAANKLAADLEYAKSMAISRGQSYTVIFDESAENYKIKDSSDTIIEHPIRKGDYIEQFGGTSGLSKVNISVANFNSTSSVTFSSIGSPDNGGTVTLAADNDEMIINVEAVTGYISISN